MNGLRAAVLLGGAVSVLFGWSPAALAQVSDPAASAPIGRSAPVAGPTVQLVTNHPRARLQQQLQLRWTDVCAAPCGIPVNPAATYRVAGGSLRPTNSFSMPRPAGTVLVDAKMGSNVKHWVGIGLTIGGGVNLLWGGLDLIAAHHVSGDLPGIDISKKEYFTVSGIVTLIVGGILTGIGLPLALATSSADVR
ncbi:MAG TPA: hypothetical protein VIU64_20030 [Polyangia bacterium]